MSTVLIDVVGDVTEPVVEEGVRVILQGNNQHSIWGSGLVIPIKKKWPHVYEENKELCDNRYLYNDILGGVIDNYQGRIQPVWVDEKTVVCNCFTQSMIGNFFELPAVRYEALEECLIRVREYLLPKLDNPTIHTPAIGCGLAGGDIETVRKIFTNVFLSGKTPPPPIYWYTYKG